MMTRNNQNLGSVLVTGGNGFMATHLIKTLIARNVCSSITALDLNPPLDPIANVTYVQGSVTSSSIIQDTLRTCGPDVIFHTASPNVTTNRDHPQIFYDVNVTGTRLLLEAADRANVKAFVFTSTCDVYLGDTHKDLKEDAPICTKESSPTGHEYPVSKALAEELVLSSCEATEMKCVILRPTHLYGDGDTHAIPVALDVCAPYWPLVQLGAGKNVFDILSTENCAAVHILAAQCLLNPSLAKGPVSKQIFNISDGPAINFWDFFIVIYSESRGHDIRPELWVMPDWLVWFLVSAIEWAWWVATAGTKRPQGKEWMERSIMVFVTGDHEYDGSKAERVLGYRPQGNWKDVLRKAVRWEIERREGEARVMWGRKTL